MTDETNRRLADAHARLAEAKAQLGAATTAAEKARDFAAQMALEVLGHVKRDQALASSRAEDLKKAMRTGGQPAFKSSPKMANTHIERLDAENRAAAAKQ